MATKAAEELLKIATRELDEHKQDERMILLGLVVLVEFKRAVDRMATALEEIVDKMPRK